MNRQKGDNPYVYPYKTVPPKGILGDMPPQRTVTDQLSQVFYGCGVTELYDPAEGVLGSGPYNGERSVTDKWMQRQYGCGSQESFQFQDQKKNTEMRRRDEMNSQLRQNAQNLISEGFCGGRKTCSCAPGCSCPFARTSDQVFNPWNSMARNVVLR